MFDGFCIFQLSVVSVAQAPKASYKMEKSERRVLTVFLFKLKLLDKLNE